MTKYKKVLCIYPYFQEVPIYEFFPPSGLEYIAAAIQDLVQNISIIDLRYEKNFKEIINNGADIFFVSVNWAYEYESLCDIIRSLPKHIMTVVGGRCATENVEELFNQCPNIDIIVRGDGEETIREFLIKDTPVGIDGLSYRQNNQIIHNPNRWYPPVSNDLLPLRKLRKYTYYMSAQRQSLGYSFDTVLSSRGCPFNCTFCSFRLNPLGQKRNWSARSPESVIRELKEIKAKVVAFVDDNFFADIKRAEKICDLIIEEKIKKIFLANARITVAFQPRLVDKMQKAGFRLLMIGVESAQEKTLKQLNKGITKKQIKEAFGILRKTKMLTNGYFIIGCIGETEEEMLEIAPFATDIGLDFVSLNRLRFEKYSGLKAVLDENRDYYVGEGNHIYSNKYGAKEINRILKQIRAEFFNKKHILATIIKGIRIGFPGWTFYLKVPFILPKIFKRLKEQSAKEKLIISEKDEGTVKKDQEVIVSSK